MSNVNNLCVACKSNLAEFGKQGKYTYCVCTQCETLQQNPLPSKEQLALEYQNIYARQGHYAFNYEEAMQANRNFYHQIIEILYRFQRPAGIVLDYGCGYGGLCAMLEAAKIDYVGYDLSNDEVQIARDRNLNVHFGGINDISRDLKVSAMIMTFVFEHLVDYDEFLEKCKKIIMRQGIIIIIIPTSPFIVKLWIIARFLGIKSDLPTFNEAITPPWHTVIFSSRGMRALMTRHGIDVERIQRSPKSRTGGLLGLTKIVLEFVEKVGFGLFGEKFPLMTAQTFICRMK
ncbi:MAG: methyltransferase domain-containing protein [Candidatus Sumerlaeota bacterium]|nr:methyltransferase domain-containing protein [Candidatus Sumerlaeota bacterium]